MELAADIQAFGRACERLLASMAIHRSLRHDELLFVRHYCKEVLENMECYPTSRSSDSIKP
jgi:hypothetical protein